MRTCRHQSMPTQCPGPDLTTTTIATTAGDFGGYTIPIVGLFLLAATISFLAGPLED